MIQYYLWSINAFKLIYRPETNYSKTSASQPWFSLWNSASNPLKGKISAKLTFSPLQMIGIYSQSSGVKFHFYPEIYAPAERLDICNMVPSSQKRFLLNSLVQQKRELKRPKLEKRQNTCLCWKTLQASLCGSPLCWPLKLESEDLLQPQPNKSSKSWGCRWRTFQDSLKVFRPQ